MSASASGSGHPGADIRALARPLPPGALEEIRAGLPVSRAERAALARVARLRARAVRARADARALAVVAALADGEAESVAAEIRDGLPGGGVLGRCRRFPSGEALRLLAEILADG